MEEMSSMEFEIVKEPWNKYQLRDNSILKARHILTSVRRTIRRDGGHQYDSDTQSIVVVHADPGLKGNTNPDQISRDEISKSIEVEDMPYDSLANEANEYVLDDRTKIIMHVNIINIARSGLKDQHGDPVYDIRFGVHLVIKPAT